MSPLTGLLVAACGLMAVAVYLLGRHGWDEGRVVFARVERVYDLTLRQQLLVEVEPRVAVWITLGFAVLIGLLTGVAAGSPIAGFVGLGLAACAPYVVFQHLRTKRRQKLDDQLIDGLTTLASGTRAGLNLIQSMQLVVDNSVGPIQQEFRQVLREHEMGIDLNQAMRNASDRIGSRLYRLTFTAIQMHRLRGGDAAQSMDRLADAIREIKRLEGKLDAVTAQGRTQATMMSVMPLVFLVILYVIDREGVTQLFTTSSGRMILLIVAALIAAGFVWIRKILAVDI